MNNLFLSTEYRRKVLECGYTIVSEGIFHPDRVMHEFVLLYMISGSWNVYIGDECFSISAGDILLMPPRVRHYSLEKCSNDMKNMYIHFCPVPGDLLYSASSLTVPVHIRFSNADNPSSDFRNIINLFYSCHSVNRDFLLSCHLEVLLGRISEEMMEKNDEDTFPPLISDVIRLFTESPERFFSQDEVARRFDVSIRNLTSKFKSATGTSLHAWQINHKLSLIHDILRYDSSRKLHDLAESYGFYDEFQLSRLYKKKYGFSPKQGRSR